MSRLYTAIINKSEKVDVDVGTVLEIISMCQTLHVLPISGGLLDQDSLFIYFYNYVEECREVRRKIDENKEKINAPYKKARSVGR